MKTITWVIGAGLAACSPNASTTPMPKDEPASRPHEVAMAEVMKMAQDAHSLGATENEPPPLSEPERPPLTPSKAAKQSKRGIATEVLKVGKGTRHPTEKNRVSVYFALWSSSGQLLERPGTQPEYMEVGGMPGWVEGMKLMVEGEKRRIWIPAKLATKADKTSMGDLIVDIELIEILE